MFCTNCGGENPNDAPFCKYCGTPIAYNNAERPANQVNNEKENEEEIVISPRTEVFLSFVLTIGVAILYDYLIDRFDLRVNEIMSYVILLVAGFLNIVGLGIGCILIKNKSYKIVGWITTIIGIILCLQYVYILFNNLYHLIFD